MLLLKRVVFISLVFWACTISARNQASPLTDVQEAQQAILALELALADVRKRNDGMPDLSRLAYTEEQRDDAGNRLVRAYIPGATESQPGTWEVLERQGDKTDGNPLQWSIDLILDAGSMSAGDLSYESSTPSHWVFVMKVGVSLTATTPDRDIDADPSNMSENLITRLHVSKSSNTITSMHVANMKPFKPASLTKVDTFKIDIYYEPMFADGPMVVKQVTRALEASYGFFFSVSEHVRLNFSQFRFVLPGSDSMSAG